MGYEIEWSEPVDKSNSYIPEFTIISGGNKVEVECKSKRADTGRKIRRPYFYRLVDEIAGPLWAKEYTGKVKIVVPDRMPTKSVWNKEVSKAIHHLITSQEVQIYLADGTEIMIDLHRLGGLVVPAEKTIAEAQTAKHPYSYLAVFAKEDGKTLTNPLIFELKSRNDDHFLKDVFNELRTANRQFSGQSSAIIFCFLPEVDSFAGLRQDSALFRMTATFFRRHAGPYVLAVSYSSDAIRTVTSIETTRSSPAIRLDNPFYDEKFGPRIRVFQ